MITNKIVHEKTQANPISNTGLNLTQNNVIDIRKYLVNKVIERGSGEVSNFLDWLTLNGELYEEQLSIVYNQILIGGFWNRNDDVSQETYNRPRHRGGQTVKDVAKSENGIEAYITPIDGGKYRVSITINGKAMEKLFARNNGLEYARFMWLCNKIGLTASRIDNSISDPSKMLDIIQLFGIALQGNYTGCTKFDFRGSGNKQGVDGLTLYFGSRQSDSYYRIYDEYAKHENIAVRIENEVKDTKAKNLQAFLVMMHETFSNAYERLQNNCMDAMKGIGSFADMVHKFLSVVREDTDAVKDLIEYHNEMINLKLRQYCLGNVNFIDVSSKPKNGSVKDCPQIPLWSNFVNKVLDYEQPMKIKSRKSKPDLKAKANWLRKAVKGTLGILRKGLPVEDFIDVLKLLLLEDNDKTYPKDIEQEREVAIAQLQKQGMYGLFTQEQLNEIKEKHDIEFRSANYDDYNHLVCYDHPEISFGQKDTPLYNYIKHNPEWIKPIFEQFPLIFAAISKFLTLDERDEVILYCQNWQEVELDEKWQKIYRRVGFV